MSEPASIRYKNPGAMWGSALAIKWGAAKTPVTLNDGKKQGNNIAVFPSFVQGICAQLDLWRTSKNYRNKRFCDAIAIWSGGNSVESYISFVLARVPGMTRNTVMDAAFWSGPMCIPFLKAQAWHEAGKPYPAAEADWTAAKNRVLSGVPTADTVKKATFATTAGLAVAAAAAPASGLSLPVALAIGLGIAFVVFLVWKFKSRPASSDIPHPLAVADAASPPEPST